MKASRCRALFWCFCVYFQQVKYQNDESKSKQLETFFLINQTKIYAKSESLRVPSYNVSSSQSRLKTSSRRYAAWRQNWNICLTVVILWDWETLEQNIWRRGVFALENTLGLLCIAVLGTIFLGLFLLRNLLTFYLIMHIFVCK